MCCNAWKYNSLSDGGGKGTCEPSQLTVAKTETQHPALPFNDDDDDDDDDESDV